MQKSLALFMGARSSRGCTLRAEKCSIVTTVWSNRRPAVAFSAPTVGANDSMGWGWAKTTTEKSTMRGNPFEGSPSAGQITAKTNHMISMYIAS